MLFRSELEQAYRTSSVYQLSEEDRAKIVRFRLKPDVRRGDRQVIRLDTSGAINSPAVGQEKQPRWASQVR